MWEKIGIWLADKVATRLAGPFMKRLEEAFVERIKSKPPTETIRIVPAPYEDPRWYFAFTPDEGEEAMVFRVSWFITNITERELTIVSVRLEAPPSAARGSRKILGSSEFAYGPLLPHEPAEFQVWFWVVPAKEGTPKQPIASKVTLVDQYANQYPLEVTFQHDPRSDETC